MLTVKDQDGIPGESHIPARGFSGPEGIVLSAQVFHSATDTSVGSVLTEVGQSEKQAVFSRCFLCLGFPHGQFQGQTGPLGETEIVPLYHASRDVCASSWFPHGNEWMMGRERRDSLWCWCYTGCQMTGKAHSLFEPQLLTCRTGIMLLTAWVCCGA